METAEILARRESSFFVVPALENRLSRRSHMAENERGDSGRDPALWVDTGA
ncbi:hypothetical protein HCTV5_167 [Halovirus HCTV-5]|uniref:hypothetical protein n=1 Tax=Halovirus HCTV-5 TaxID=1273748 RepID=UPI00033482D2|nr:hypothetical protein M200_gp065 [Halovirus HCTV-5]AGM11769.1 hypothetical protein HCTV5_167 [Halovirus HCTV-5]